MIAGSSGRAPLSRRATSPGSDTFDRVVGVIPRCIASRSLQRSNRRGEDRLGENKPMINLILTKTAKQDKPAILAIAVVTLPTKEANGKIAFRQACPIYVFPVRPPPPPVWYPRMVPRHITFPFCADFAACG